MQAALSSPSASEEDFKLTPEFFAQMDEDSIGVVDVADVKAVLAVMGASTDIDGLMKSAGLSGKAELDYAEYARLMEAQEPKKAEDERLVKTPEPGEKDDGSKKAEDERLMKTPEPEGKEEGSEADRGERQKKLRKGFLRKALATGVLNRDSLKSKPPAYWANMVGAAARSADKGKEEDTEEELRKEFLRKTLRSGILNKVPAKPKPPSY